MRTLSAAYLNAAKAAGRYPNCYAIIYGANSTLTLDGKSALISAHIILGDTAKPAYFEVGRALSGSATVTVDRRRISDESLIVSGAKIEIYAEFDQPSGTAIASNILATMYISGYDNEDSDIGYISAVDRMVYTGGDFNPDNLTYPITLSDLFAEAFDQSGLSGVTVTLPCDPHVNTAPYKAAEPVADGMSGDPYTCREVIAKIAGMQMSDVFIDASGQPKVYAYGSFITGAITDGMTLERFIGAETFEIYQVHVYHTDERMPKDSAHYKHLAYNPRFEDMDEIGSGSAWWDEIVARANVFARKDWTTARVTFAGVGELELGDFVECGSDAIPLFVSGVEYNFENSAFTETVYSYAFTKEEYFQAPAKATVVSTDAEKQTASGVGEDLGNGNERFNAYDDSGNHNTIDGGSYNHAEGNGNTLTNGCYATHIEGYGNSASYTNRSFISGNHNTVTNGYCHIVSGEGNTVTNGGISVISGQNNTVTNSYDSAVFGSSNQVTGGGRNVVCGQYNTVTGGYSVVTGDSNTASGSGSVTAGDDNNNSGSRSSVCGIQNTNSGGNAVVAGNQNTNTGRDAAVFGEYNENYADDAMVCGDYNINRESDAIMCGVGGENTQYYFAIGNGNSSSRSLCFYVTATGATYAAGGYGSPGADYAEYFEWADGAPGNEDRRGLLVRLEGDKITLADSDDILGAVSANPSVIGNSADEHWRGKYVTDIFGDCILDENGERMLSDDYDPEAEYIPRSERPEWAAVGLVGRLIVCDNGKCKPGGCVSARKGIAVPTLSETHARCLKRLDEKHIEILVR